MKEIQVLQPYEEIKIGNGTFKVDISDAALAQYDGDSDMMKALMDLGDAAADMTMHAFIEKTRGTLKTLINEHMFLDAPFDVIYAECGKSCIVMAGIIRQVVGIVAEGMTRRKEALTRQYKK